MESEPGGQLGHAADARTFWRHFLVGTPLSRAIARGSQACELNDETEVRLIRGFGEIANQPQEHDNWVNLAGQTALSPDSGARQEGLTDPAAWQSDGPF